MSHGEPLDIGSRRELFVDEYLLKTTSNVGLEVQRPTLHEVVLEFDEPWDRLGDVTPRRYPVIIEDEENTVEDGARYRMWYKANLHESLMESETDLHEKPQVRCYAESDDGLSWRKPDLGLVEVDGSTQNNVVWRTSLGPGMSAINFCPMKDPTEPADSDARYKAIGGSGTHFDQLGLYGLTSPDGLKWSPLQEEPLLPEEWGSYDSLNTLFWDPNIEAYRCYSRYFTEGWPDGNRAIQVSTAEDFREWTEPEPLTYEPDQEHGFYVNNLMTYPRAPHLYVGFPVRYFGRAEGFGPETEPTFVASRDGRHFRWYKKALVPRDAPKGRDGNRGNYIDYGMVQLPGDDGVYTMYATEGGGDRTRRITYRLDGFVALTTDSKGTAVTKPLRFDGSSLVCNYETGEGGSVDIGILQPNGDPYPGFSPKAASTLSGDAIDEPVTWDGDRGLETLAGSPIRLRFDLANADVYSFQFQAG